MNLIQKACDYVGGQTALAKILTEITGKEVTQQRVRNWIFRGDDVPTEFLAPIEQVTGGAVSRKDFRPDDWQSIWPELLPVIEKAADIRHAVPPYEKSNEEQRRETDLGYRQPADPHKVDA